MTNTNFQSTPYSVPSESHRQATPFKLAFCESDRPSSSMQCSQGSLSTCPTTRTSPSQENTYHLAPDRLMDETCLKNFPKSHLSACQTETAVIEHNFYPSPTRFYCPASPALRAGPASINDLSDSVKILFNVGGKKYWSTVSTIRGGASTLFPEDENCFFQRMVKTPWASNLIYNEDCVECYIDRNGKCFPYILDYVRRGGLTCTDDRGLLDMIAFEADFYGLSRLRRMAEHRLQELQEKEEKMLSLGSSLGDVLSRLVAVEQRAFMPSEVCTAPAVGCRTSGIDCWSSSSSQRASSHQSGDWSAGGEWPARHLPSDSRSPYQGSDLTSSPRSSFEQSRALLINDDPETPCEGASPDVLSKFFSHDRKFATDEDF
eukprot:Blabericola_migrator_1__11619@NODE_698_length_6826_cov_185_661340_g507_i0_p3_GENE_NODE_698_length_6826_cov_185_661340_g507_i0NODE_698_length_6826_cov_185_661340_g507_i0_p3_ORF_typecomplete_len375_score26_53BTB_2/PF02214_22/5_9e03BTB_2/PF02214_22/1_1e13_NODE_698_length_6826_cov_185_661340_g507_i022273351